MRPWFDSWVGKIRCRRDRLPTPVFLGFPCGSAGKESACNAGDLGSIPGLGRCPGEEKGYPLQYPGLYTVHGVTKSWIQLSDFHFHFSHWCWERWKAGEGDKGRDGWMAWPTQWTWVWASSGRWWRTGKPGMLKSMGLQRVRHDWVTEQQLNILNIPC